jgi:phenylalanyl-tRNA synthetase beta chain
MKVPISWLREYVDIKLSIPELAHRLTLAGLEVEEIRYVGLPLPEGEMDPQSGRRRSIGAKVTGLAWDPAKIVVGAILEVMPHPDADRLVLCRLDDGDQEHTVVTGASNLFPYRGEGLLATPLKVAYAREGAKLFDGHQEHEQLFTLKRAKIRGVESYSMACSEKELGISEEHEGVILLAADAPVGAALVEYMGDAVLDITLTPNVARDANIIGVAREVSALTGVPLREPNYEVPWNGPAIEGRVRLDIHEPELNPRFVLGLLEGIEIGPSPYHVQLRLKLAGMRPINNVVDATNYAMLEVGEPLHAFDFDVLVQRAGGDAPTIHTRLPSKSEKLTTLDGVERQLDEFTVLVADTSGALSIAGVMGGADSEVSESTQRVLLEGASWNFINIRRTVAAQSLQSEASYRFERGVHPAMAERGVRRGLILMQQLAGGKIAEGLVDTYPLPAKTPVVSLTTADVERWLGVHLEPSEICEILQGLGFEVIAVGDELTITPPDHRMDIGEGVIGKADLMEEVARIYGYDRLPETMIADEIPPQHDLPLMQAEEQIRDDLAGLGLQEIVTYRLTTPEREARLLPPGERADDRPYLRLEHPISSDRIVLRHSLLASLMEIAESNARFRKRLVLYEIGPVYLASEGDPLPEEPLRLALIASGPREPRHWSNDPAGMMDFFDLKGIIVTLFENLHLEGLKFENNAHPSFHPGKSARILLQADQIGVMGELHPLVKAQYDLGPSAVLAAELELEPVLKRISEAISVQTVKTYPPVLEDLALVVADSITAEQVLSVIRAAGGELMEEVELFDVYRGEQVGPDRKSLAFALTYQASDRTLTTEEVGQIRQKVIKRVEQELGARLRA